MKFEKEKAEVIISRYHLSEKTISVWKSRGYIPKKYLGEKDINKIDQKKENEIKLIFSKNILNKSKFDFYSKISDIIRGKGHLKQHEFDKILIEINILIKDLKYYNKISFENILKLENLFLDKRFKRYCIFNPKIVSRFQKGFGSATTIDDFKEIKNRINEILKILTVL